MRSTIYGFRAVVGKLAYNLAQVESNFCLSLNSLTGWNLNLQASLLCSFLARFGFLLIIFDICDISKRPYSFIVCPLGLGKLGMADFVVSAGKQLGCYLLDSLLVHLTFFKIFSLSLNGGRSQTHTVPLMVIRAEPVSITLSSST